MAAAPARILLIDDEAPIRRFLKIVLNTGGFEVTEAVLNHVSGSRSGIAGVYQRHGWGPEKRAALDAWGSHVEGLLKPTENTENVVALRRA